MRRKNKSIYIVLIVVALIGITIGYAVINTTLNINGKSSISKNTWDIYFDNVVVKDGSVETVKIPTVTDKTTVDFEVTLNLPGDFYEFTVDVVNSGTIDAMIESINKTPDLTAAQAKYLNYIISYQNGEEIQSKQLVKSKEFVRLKVRVEYKKDITASDLPTTTETLNLGFTVNYVQSDGSGSSVKDNGVFKITANGDINEIGTVVTIGSEQFYTIGTEGENVKLLSMYNLYVGGSYDGSTWTPYGSEVTGRQDSNMSGYLSGLTIMKGTTEFSTSKYWVEDDELKVEYGTSYPAYVYDLNSTLYSYVENYKIYLSTLGVPLSEARLIKIEELENLGCSGSSCSAAPSWVYSTSYWSGSAESFFALSRVTSNGAFYGLIYTNNSYFGVRPVIVISKSLF